MPGTDVNLAAVNGVTPLMAAAYAGQTEMVGDARWREARTSTREDRLKKNAMTYAAGEGHTEIVQMLLAKGVDPNAVYDNDLTALMWAAGYGRTATVKALLDAGARADSGTIAARRRWTWRAKASTPKPRHCSNDTRSFGRGELASPGDEPPFRAYRPRGSTLQRKRPLPIPIRASSPSRSTSACFSAPATCIAISGRDRPARRQGARTLRISLSATFFPDQPGSVMPKYRTGYPLNSEPR